MRRSCSRLWSKTPSFRTDLGPCVVGYLAHGHDACPPPHRVAAAQHRVATVYLVEAANSTGVGRSCPSHAIGVRLSRRVPEASWRRCDAQGRGILQHADGHMTVIGGEADGEALSVGEGGEFGRGGCWLTLACHRWLAVEDKVGLAVSLVVLKADVGLVAGRLDTRDAAAVGLDDACAILMRAYGVDRQKSSTAALVRVSSAATRPRRSSTSASLV